MFDIKQEQPAKRGANQPPEVDMRTHVLKDARYYMNLPDFDPSAQAEQVVLPAGTFEPSSPPYPQVSSQAARLSLGAEVTPSAVDAASASLDAAVVLQQVYQIHDGEIN